MNEIKLLLYNDLSKGRISRTISSDSPDPSSKKSDKEDSIGRRLIRFGLQALYNLENSKFELSENGKPYINDNVFFNLSHSGHTYLVALSKKAQIGVDIELRISEKRFLKIANRYFGHEELSYINSFQSLHEKQIAFNHLWVLKESYIKAFGCDAKILFSDLNFSFNDRQVIHPSKPDKVQSSLVQVDQEFIGITSLGPIDSIKCYSIDFDGDQFTLGLEMSSPLKILQNFY